MTPSRLLVTFLALAACVPACLVAVAMQDEADQDDSGQLDNAEQDVESGADHQHAEGEELAEEEPQGSAPETFDPLLEEFHSLTREIDESAGSAMTHQDEVRDLRTKVTTFNDERQPTELSIAVEIQLILWAADYGEPRDAAFARLDSLEVASPGLRVLWAQHLKERQYKFEKAIEVLDGGDIDLAKYPIAAVIRAEALVPQNRFDEAEAALQSIPQGAPVRPDLLDRIYFQRQQIDELKEDWSNEAALREADAAADDLPRVSIETSRGPIVVELYENEAPNTVANFITLVEQGFYANTLFYQVVPNSYVAAGDPVVLAVEVPEAPPGERPNYQLPVELPKPEDPPSDDADDTSAAEDQPADADAPPGEGDQPPAEGATPPAEGGTEAVEPVEIIPLPERSRDHFAGVLSMERAGENIDPSRFIITLRRRADRDGRNVVFGRVIEGMALVREITGDDHIISASVLRKREHPYEAKKIEIAVEEEAAPPLDAEAQAPADESGDANPGEGDGAPPPAGSENEAGEDDGDGE